MTKLSAGGVYVPDPNDRVGRVNGACEILSTYLESETKKLTLIFWCLIDVSRFRVFIEASSQSSADITFDVFIFVPANMFIHAILIALNFSTLFNHFIYTINYSRRICDSLMRIANPPSDTQKTIQLWVPPLCLFALADSFIFLIIVSIAGSVLLTRCRLHTWPSPNESTVLACATPALPPSRSRQRAARFDYSWTFQSSMSFFVRRQRAESSTRRTAKKHSFSRLTRIMFYLN